MQRPLGVELNSVCENLDRFREALTFAVRLKDLPGRSEQEEAYEKAATILFDTVIAGLGAESDALSRIGEPAEDNGGRG